VFVDGPQPVLDRSGPQQGRLFGAGPARNDEDVGSWNLIEGGVGDDGKAAGVAPHRPSLFTDDDRVGSRQPAEDFVRAHGVERGHVVVDEDGDLHGATVRLRVGPHIGYHPSDPAQAAPTRWAMAAASTRLLTPSLRRMFDTWTLAVFSDT
jgi:hypothetical protein